MKTLKPKKQICPKCEKNKTYLYPSGRRSAYCKPCKNAYQNELFRTDPKWRATMRKCMKRWQKENPVAYIKTMLRYWRRKLREAEKE